MIVLQLFGIFCGLCLIIGVIGGTVQTIRKCGFEVADLVIMPVGAFLVLAGAGMILVSFSTMLP
jgi:hypothetical protein